LRREIRGFFTYLESELGDGPWITGGDFSAADVMMGYVVEVAASRGYVDESEHPRLRDYLTRLRERPAHRRTLEA